MIKVARRIETKYWGLASDQIDPMLHHDMREDFELAFDEIVNAERYEFKYGFQWLINDLTSDFPGGEDTESIKRQWLT